MKNVIVLQSSFIEILKDIDKIPRTLPNVSSSNMYQNDELIYESNSSFELLSRKIHKLKLKPLKKIGTERPIFAYDESIRKYSCLEGEGYLTSHALIEVTEKDYKPIGLVSFYFYTKSKKMLEYSNSIKYVDDIERESKRDYIKDRIEFLVENTPKGAILLIDGPLIGGDVYTYMIRAINQFLSKDIIPIFFVKNSSSNIVSDNVINIRDKYHSDMHWSYMYLSKGERTSFFLYQDKINELNSKIFTYLKAFNKSPQRVEFHTETFKEYKDEIEQLMNNLYYYIIIQGEKNPQVRPIAIAELYAREFLKIIDFDKKFFKKGFTPTMNQERFGR